MKSDTGKPLTQISMYSDDKTGLVLPKGAKANANIMNKKMDGQKDQSKLEEKKVNSYNRSVKKPLKSYQDVKFISGTILVRLFKIPYLTKGGLVNHRTYQIPSPSGTRMQTLVDPFPYENRGIVINMDENLKSASYTLPLNIGDEVIVRETLVDTFIPQSGVASIPNMFQLPVDRDRDFLGHITITSRDILCILPKSK